MAEQPQDSEVQTTIPEEGTPEMGEAIANSEASGFVGEEAATEAVTADTELKPILTETQQNRLDKLTADKQELEEIVKDLEAAEKAQSRVVDRTSPGKKREAAFKDWNKVQKQVTAEKTRLNKVQADIDKINEAGLAKAKAAADKEAKKKEKEEKEEAALAKKDEGKYDDFVCRVLTDEERERRSAMEADAFKLMDEVKAGTIAFARKVQEIIDAGLYVDHPGGKFQYIEDTFGIGKNQFNRYGVQLRVFDAIAEIKALPPKPDEGIDLSDFNPEEMPERQARELHRAGGKEEQAKVLTAVLQDAKLTGRPVTADDIREVVEHLRTSEEVVPPSKIKEARAEKRKEKTAQTPTGVTNPAPSVLSSSVLGEPDEATSLWRNYGHEYLLKAANTTIDGAKARRFTVAIDGTFVGTEFQNAIAAKEHLEMVAKAHKSQFTKDTNWPEDNADEPTDTATDSVSPDATPTLTAAAAAATADGSGLSEAGPGRNGAHPKPLANGEDGNEYYIGVEEEGGKPEVYAHNPATGGEFSLAKTGYVSVEGPMTQAEAHKRFKEINKARRQAAAASA